ncbi:hypothetical protein VaNZ11_015898, partial [Volvox africanus]
PVGLNANLRGFRESETDGDYGEAADASYGISPTAKRTTTPGQTAPHLTSEQQALIFRCKPKPSRPSISDSDASLPAAASPTAMPPKCQEGLCSVYSVTRTSSCHLSDGMRTPGPELQQSPQLRQQLSIQQQQQQQSLTPQRQSLVLPRQASMLQQQHLMLQRQTQGSPHLIRQGQALIPSGALIHLVDSDGSSDTQYGCSKASAGSYDVRSLPSRSTTPTGRSVSIFHSRRDSQGWVGLHPATGMGSGGCGNTVFNATSGLATASAEASGATTVAGSSVDVGIAVSAPIVSTSFPAAYIVGDGSGSSLPGGSSIRSPLASPLSAPSLHGTQRLSICRSAFFQSPCVHAPVAPGSPQAPPAPVSPGTPSPPPQHSPSLNHHKQHATVISANVTTQGELASSYGRARSPSRRLLGPVGFSGRGAGAGGSGAPSGAVVAQILERSGGGSSPLPKLFSSFTSGQSFSGPIAPATGLWPQSTAASGGNEIGPEDGELIVTRRSCSAIAAVMGGGLPARGAPDRSESSGRTSTVLTNGNENDYECRQGGVVRAAAAPAGQGASADTHRDEGGRQSFNLGELLKEYEYEGPLSAAARQLAALHRAHEKSKAQRGLIKGQPSERQGPSSRWRSARTGRG